MKGFGPFKTFDVEKANNYVREVIEAYSDDPEMLVHMVTACPFEAESYTEDSDQMVEGVMMPPEIAAWVKTFCDTHHKDVPFKKRKRKSYDPRKGDFMRPRHGGRNG